MRKLFSLFALMTCFVASPLASADSSGTLVLDESAANVYPDGVYYDSVINQDQTVAAADSTVDDVYLPDVGMDPDVLYIGSNTVFDEITFDITTAGDSSRICMMTTCHHYDLEYYDGSTSDWESLSYTDNTNNFETTGVASWEFEVPAAWDEDGTKTTVNGQTLFWVRITPNENATINSPASAAEVALHAYNLELTVEDELGNPMDELVSEDFEIDGGTSNATTGIRTMEDGVFQFALDAGLSDSSYTVSVHQTGYVSEEVSTGVLGSIQKSFVVELSRDPSVCAADFEDIYGHWAEAYIEELFCRDVVDGKDEVTFDPSGEATRAEFLKIALLNAGYDVEGATGGEEFDDVSTGDWFYEYVSFGAEEGFIEGYDDGTFLPNAPINRAEALVITMRIAGVAEYEVDADWEEFYDVSSTDWFAYAVEVAADEGIVEGYDDGNFRPENNITRAEVATISVRTYELYYAE